MADNLTREQRSYCMSRIKGRDTALEITMRSELFRRGLRFRKHVTTLPGKPDVVFPLAKVAVFLDGDFWHGYRFPIWRSTLSKFWRVIRIWQHEIQRDLSSCVNRVVSKYTTTVRASRSR